VKADAKQLLGILPKSGRIPGRQVGMESSFMPLEEIALSLTRSVLPARVGALLRESDARIDRFISERIDAPLPGFVPSDFVEVYSALKALRTGYLTTGDMFCEWGSGFGVAASLAAMLRFNAYGIEIQEDLVRAARSLAEDFNLSVQFFHGSFIPPGGEAITDTVDEFSWLEPGGLCAQEEMGLDPDDFDVIFAYPWPGEAHVIEALFEEYAAVGALLLTYNGLEDIKLFRKKAVK